ncbi:MAG TPA: hypothetical protein VGN95_10975 [Pyrinomonadaceae bacterium]|jgi:hypothetical protein|nr:hypothetical protein [Pyrinomonadaceae bacterium]
MSEQKKWVGYADLLEAKRKREERESREEPTAPAHDKTTAPEDEQQTPAILHPVEKEPDAEPTPVITPVTTPVSTPAVTGVTTPVFTAAEASLPLIRPSGEESPIQAQYLDATHTASEQRIYSVMYRETVSRGIRERHFGPSELCRKTGIRSDRTIRTAIHGLIQKLSIQTVSNVNGNPLGPRYKVFDPKEIIKRRRTSGIEIDSQSKKIINQNPLTPVVTPVVTPATTTASTGDKSYRGTPVEITGVTPVDFTGVSKYINTDYETEDSTASSSSKSISENADDDNAFLDSLREVYERATGNSWTTTDAVTAQRGQDIPLEVWGIAICYCVDRAPGHKFDRLAYVSEEARRHFDEMKNFSKEDLRVIMRHGLRQIERARTSGRWEPTVQEEGREVSSDES